ncbi:MAG: ATP-binding protein [Paracoccus sp. (in: a-proteobacteria)]|uniref:ATP-binding protein n=1 Tax=Paracoccus sp. TaxID=267 RepID=UPI0026E0545A|nr:ATP-binding protein [Paracoccus sp. (in: a-proteobacteria)]MDO5612045.1 ATP-binding protein [Paracoccus sp. (in: a-proteobacteria)]
MANNGDNGWLKRLVPRGIYGRAALILFLPVITVTLVVTLMFLQRHFEGVTRQMTATTAREVALVAARIAAAPDADAARAAVADIVGPLELVLTMPVPAAAQDQREFYDFSGRVVIEELRAELPDLRAVDLVGNYRDVRLTLDAPAGPYGISFDRRRVSASNPHQLLVLMVFTSLLMTGIATIFLRNQLRPIRRLARAAEEYGKGRIVPYRPAGASEVRSAGTAFVDMRNRLERSSEQRTMMLSGISHDLRTPLTRLRLSVSMLSPDMPPDAEDITAMEGDIAQMSQMVSAFLDFARDAAQDRAPESVAALPFLQAIVADAQRAGQAVTLTRAEGGESVQIVARPDTLRRALENLIGNAVRHGTRAEVEAVLGPRSLLIAVEDDGPGIPEHRLDEAIRPFTRLDPARGQNVGQGGAGLGLSIAADVARAHGGRLRLTRGNRLGGLRAEIMLPR